MAAGLCLPGKLQLVDFPGSGFGCLADCIGYGEFSGDPGSAGESCQEPQNGLNFIVKEVRSVKIRNVSLY